MLEFLPDTYKLYEKVIELYIEKGEFREKLNIKDAAYIIVSSLINLENYNGNKENYGEILINIFNLVVEGYKKKSKDKYHGI